MLFVTKIYYINDKQKSVRIIDFDETKFKINSMKIIRDDKFLDFNESNKLEKKNYVYNESKNEFFCKDESVIRENCDSVHNLPEEMEKVYSDAIISLYDLLFKLADLDALYIEKCNDYYIYNSFRFTKVSKSSMIVGINLNDHGNWKSRKIVDVRDGKLVQHSFMLALPKEDVGEFKYISLEKVSDTVIDNVEYVLYKYNGTLPICNSPSYFTFERPLVHHLTYLEYIYSNVLKTLKKFNNKFLMGQSSILKEPNNLIVEKENLDFTGVSIYCNSKNLSDSRCEEVICMVTNIFRDNKELNDVQLTNTLKIRLTGMLEDCTLPIARLLYKTLLHGFDTSMPNMITFITNSICDYSHIYLRISLFLYNIRVSCIFNPSLLYFTEGKNKYLIDDRFMTVIERNGV